MKFLFDEHGGRVKLGARKRMVLGNTAKSLIETFPRLASQIRPDENPKWKYVWPLVILKNFFELNSL